MSGEPPKIVSLGARRFHQTRDTTKTTVREALEAALEFADESKPDHVIVLFAKVDGGETESRYFQAGSYAYHAQMGLCTNAALQLRASSIDESND